MDSSNNPEATIPVVCTLTNKAAAGQALEWVDLQRRATSTAAVDGGVRMCLPADMVDDVEDLARSERQCCAFLTITTSVEGDTLTLEVTSDNVDALPVISALAGIVLP